MFAVVQGFGPFGDFDPNPSELLVRSLAERCDADIQTEVLPVSVDRVRTEVPKLMEEYRPQVVITYDENGGYQHPDHVHAARAATAAVADTGIPAKLYLTAMRISDWAKLWTALRDAGVDVPDRGDFPEETRRQMEAAEAMTAKAKFG